MAGVGARVCRLDSIVYQMAGKGAPVFIEVQRLPRSNEATGGNKSQCICFYLPPRRLQGRRCRRIGSASYTPSSADRRDNNCAFAASRWALLRPLIAPTGYPLVFPASGALSVRSVGSSGCGTAWKPGNQAGACPLCPIPGPWRQQ